MLINVPSNWNTLFDKEDSFHYGTYRLRILLDDNHDNSWGLRINQKYNNATAIYINGQLINEAGQVATSVKNYKGSNIPFSVPFNLNHNEIEILIHASSNKSSGGILKPIHFGTTDADSLSHIIIRRTATPALWCSLVT
ncbi:hypothetical protein [Lederbergia galactosidilytica]|uniref:hypothetical protein n=1 Tax=Lederbergia galactosidilytica TaxID=217031 RepID=UPI001EE3BD07|nr:hypothetical protein [Lederbergia galactosidilytica]